MLYGSYGFDLLSLFLLLLGSLFNFSRYTSPLSLLIFIIVLFRAFSKNIFKRTNELNKFIDFFNNKTALWELWGESHNAALLYKD